MTMLGKIFVLTILVISLLGCGYGVVVYFDSPNFGWKEAKGSSKDVIKPPESEQAKRKKVLDQLSAVQQTLVPNWSQARVNLANAETHVVDNQYWFYNTLARLYSADDHDIKSLKRGEKGLVVTDPKTDLPEFDKVIARKTFLGYEKELNGLNQDIDKAKDAIKTMLAKEKEYTEKLNGREDPAARTKEKGLYDLLDLEREAMLQAQAELEELKPKYLQELVDSQLYLKRRAQLLERIRELENVGIAKR